MDANSRTLYVENFPLTTTEVSLQRLFANFGKVNHLNLPKFDSTHPICRGLPVAKSKGYAFVEFATKDSADSANTLFNDLNFILNSSNGDTCSNAKLNEQLVAEKLRNNLEFKQLLQMRVMPKKRFQELTDRYNEQRFNSLVRAAKLLYTTSASK